MTLAVLNQLDAAAFTQAVGWVFEHSPWVADRAAPARPFADVAELHNAMVQQVENANPDEQLQLLRAHPDLGTRARLSEASNAEQSGAGLDSLTPEELHRFTSLNGSYKAKFGFPFLFAVQGSTKHDILRALGQRLVSSPEIESAEALRQVYRIAAFRLRDYLGLGA